MARRLEPQLKEFGCDMSANQFGEFVTKIFKEHSVHESDDEMVLHPDDAKAYCNAVRAQGREFESVPDPLILRSLIGFRKAGKRAANKK